MNFNLAVILRETADASPGKAVAVDAGGQMTYGELDALSDRLAAGLAAAGLRPGDAPTRDARITARACVIGGTCRQAGPRATMPARSAAFSRSTPG